MYYKNVNDLKSSRGENTMCYQKKTLREIEKLRHLLVKSAFDKGFTNIETIQVSQRLDCLLNRYSNIAEKQN